jgi:hypothetical protein
MIAVLIFLFSVAALLQFFVFYYRALIAESRAQEISLETRELCGLPAHGLAGDKFQRLLKLIALCAETGEDGYKVLAICAYFRLLEFARHSTQLAIPFVAPWIDEERDGCTHAVALFLDRRIAHNRMMFARQ